MTKPLETSIHVDGSGVPEPEDHAASDDIARTLGLGGPVRGRRQRWLRWSLTLALIVSALAAPLVVRRGARTPERYVSSEVQRGDLRVVVTATGTLAALGAVELGSEVSGRVQEVHVTYNQRIKKGQVLAEIDPVQFKAEEAQASAQLAASRAATTTAEVTVIETAQALQRAEAQASRGLMATKDLESAQAAHARAKAALSSANANTALALANVKSSSWKLAKTKIVSPIDGVVLSRLVEPGQTVAASFQTPVLFKLATDLSALELEVQVDESDVARVKEGLKAEFRVDAYADRVFTSSVESVRNEAKTSSNVVYYEAILSVDNSERLLRPGMTATATITSELHPDVLLVPNAALRFEPPTRSGPGPGAEPQPLAPAPLPKGKKRVYVLGARGQLEPIAVTPGATDGSNTELREAVLAPHQRVVIDIEEESP